MGFVVAMAKSDLQPGQAKCVVLQGRKIAVYNVNGRYFATDDLCTHDEASLSEGSIYEEGCRCIVECPWHGSRFDLATGQPVTLPAVKPVKTYPVRDTGDVLEVEL